MSLIEDELPNMDEKLLLDAQRAAAREDWGVVISSTDEVLKNDPRNVRALFLAARALRHLGNEGMAAQLLNVAAQLSPEEGAVWHDLAMCLHERHPEEAYRIMVDKVQALRPDTPEALSSLCNMASTVGLHAEAIAWAEKSEALHGFDPDAAHNKSFALFHLGRWAEGWKYFRAALGKGSRVERNYHADRETPRWDPSKHEKAVVVIYGEQGIGDEIMYASMINRAITAAEAKGSRVIIECDERNAGLFRRSFDRATVYGTRAETYCDWPRSERVTHKIEMGGLGEFFAPTPFRAGSFLAPDEARQRGHAAWLGPKRRPRVGIAWTGGSWETGRARRSIPFDDVLTLMLRQNVDFVCLEYEDRRADLEFAPDVLNPHWATRKGADMDDLAALVSNLDLVISVQTSVVDLCGALGVPCWAICDQVPQWRYSDHLGPDKMFFYESVKVYRQERWGHWGPVIAQVANDLRGWTAQRMVKPVRAKVWPEAETGASQTC